MSYSTKMWAVTTLSLIALLTFASTQIPALRHDIQAHTTAGFEQRLLPEQNLHTDSSGRFMRTIAAFGPMLALLFVTLVVLDNIDPDADHRSSTAERTPDLVVQPSIADDLNDWPRKFDLVVGVKGWTAVRHESEFSPYGGN